MLIIATGDHKQHGEYTWKTTQLFIHTKRRKKLIRSFFAKRERGQNSSQHSMRQTLEIGERESTTASNA